jgi:hypothetical protein
MTALQAQGRRQGLGEDDGDVDPIGDGAGHQRRGLGNGAGAQHHSLREDDVVAGSRTATRPALSMAALARVGEDGGA